MEWNGASEGERERDEKGGSERDRQRDWKQEAI